ncbi:hypothetical protein ThimaDRAFT_0662 [Thiocapsa marina 5811]|uniref:DUF1254 domain-containing protein n=1 Tax=Thiocapsa marina 5811 TaxID=768671 RepID=F9U6W0_9GAMM|nr:hypothetical protein ThimaDRAFT_0662 [Thiocapsa marina 5811]
MVFSPPDMGKRHVLFPMYSLWMPVIESAGSRTCVALTQTFLISVPDRSVEMPDDTIHIKVATGDMVIPGRTDADGTDVG